MPIFHMPTFGENLRAAMSRPRAGVSKDALATALHVTVPQVDKWLGATNVELTTIFRLAKALEVPVEVLCQGIDPEYDAMRLRDQSPARLVELWTQVQRDAPDTAKQLWRLLMSIANAPLPPRDADPASPETDPPPPADPLVEAAGIAPHTAPPTTGA